MQIAVIGAGNSGLAMAVYLKSFGHKVNLWNRSKATISDILLNNTITSEGFINGSFKIDVVSTNIQEVIEDCDLIMITTPANSHQEIAELIVKTIKNNAVIVLNPGRTFGALEVENIFKRYFKNNIIIETQSIIFTCRKINKIYVRIYTIKDNIGFSGITKSKSLLAYSLLPECLRSKFTVVNSSLYTSLGNIGMILHVAPVLFNIGWIEFPEVKFKYYYNGITKTIARFLENLDKERIAVGKKLGVDLESVTEWIQRVYHVDALDLYSMLQKVDAYKEIDAPRSLEHRYLYEDVPMGLIPLEQIGIKLGIEMKCTTMLINLANEILNEDFRETGRNLKKLKLDELNTNQIIELLNDKIK